MTTSTLPALTAEYARRSLAALREIDPRVPSLGDSIGKADTVVGVRRYLHGPACPNLRIAAIVTATGPRGGGRLYRVLNDEKGTVLRDERTAFITTGHGICDGRTGEQRVRTPIVVCNGCGVACDHHDPRVEDEDVCERCADISPLCEDSVEVSR